MDANGILNVSAKDMASGKTQNIKITAQSGLSEDEIKKLVKEAELQAEADKEKAESVQNRNNLDNLVYQTEKLVTDSGAKLSEADQASAKEMLAEAKKVLDNKSASVTELKDAFEKLQKSSHKMTEDLYKASAAQPGAEAGAEAGAAKGSNKKSGDDVIDADFKDVN
jgi:molecular chaperone DnaK